MTVFKDLLRSVLEQPTKPCPADNNTVFWRSNSSGRWSCAKHNFPMDKEDVAEILDVSTNERLSNETTTKGANVDFNQYNWDKIAKTINAKYGAAAKPSQVRKMFEETAKAAVGHSKEIAQSIMASKSLGKSGPVTPGEAIAVAQGMTAAGVREFTREFNIGPSLKSDSDGPVASDRDFYGRKKRRAELNGRSK